MTGLKIMKAPRFDIGFIPIGILPPRSIFEVIRLGEKGGRKK